LSYGATVLLETIRLMKPSKIVFSALGVREGYLYSLLPKNEQLLDPLLASADEFSILRSRSPRHARELATWTTLSLPVLGFDETDDEARYRQAACLVADISWRAHPDYRGSQALNINRCGSFGGIDHAGRSFMALANYYRHEGLIEDEIAPEIVQLATPRLRERAKLLGATSARGLPSVGFDAGRHSAPCLARGRKRHCAGGSRRSCRSDFGPSRRPPAATGETDRQEPLFRGGRRRDRGDAGIRQ
jgi:exopolyphosphatase/pppGpp-phosphohydrolase